jgi:hypothetical protein
MIIYAYKVVGLKQIVGFSSLLLLLPYQPEFDDKRTTVQLNLSAALVASQRQRAGDEERFPGGWAVAETQAAQVISCAALCCH